MFLGLESLDLLEDYFLRSPWIESINHFGITLFQSFFFSALAFFLYSYILSVLYQKKINIIRYILASLIFCLLVQGPIFAIHLFRPRTVSFHIEDLFVVPPPYMVFFLYFLCTYFLRIDKTISLSVSSKLYIIVSINVLLYYMAEAVFFFLLTNNPQFQRLIYVLAATLVCLISLGGFAYVVGFIKRHKLWLDAYKIKKSAEESIPKTLCRYLVMSITLWLFIVPNIKLISYSGSIVDVELVISAMLLICILVFYISYTGDRKKIAKTDLDNQTMHINSLIGSIDNIRTLKHDMRNMLSVYDGFIRLREWDKLFEYNALLQNETKFAEDLLDINTKYTITPVLRTLLSRKLSEAHEKGVFIKISIITDTNRINMDLLDLTRIVGILLDNAIEETSHTDARTILLALQSMKNGNILLSISNPTVNDVDIKKIMEKDYSTKKGHSGLGLFILWNIINRTDGCRLSIDYLNKVITFYLELACS